MKEIGAYIHIPFCKKKCYYCDFLSFENEENQSKYMYALEKEIENFFLKYKNIKIKTLYIGGGTPSYIKSELIKRVISKFDIKNIEEATIEVNPGTATKAKLQEYKKCGINRISIGLQTSNDFLLKKIGRIHNYEDFLKTYKNAKQIGFNNINIDLIIGLPFQNIHILKDTLEKVVNINPEHISVYSLIIEENTVIEKMKKRGELDFPSEENERNMYWYTKNFLELNGYKHYEISNFAKEGFESKHNLDCWNQKEYIGFGLGAHSYLDKIRFSNTENLKEYIENSKNNIFNRIIQEKQDENAMKKEFMLLGLRKIEGISIKEYKNRFGENPIFRFKNELKKLVEEELIEINMDNIRLTNKGLNFANQVWMEFI